MLVLKKDQTDKIINANIDQFCAKVKQFLMDRLGSDFLEDNPIDLKEYIAENVEFALSNGLTTEIEVVNFIILDLAF